MNETLAGQKVVLMGWVDTRRDHGGLVFVDLRDREGLVQVVLDPQQKEMEVSKDFRNECVVAIEGEVRPRPDGMKNDKLATGAVEVAATSCAILSHAETPPMHLNDDNVTEAVRLKYRYLDLRSNHLQKNIRLRHEVVLEVRNFLSDAGFLEVETPILYKSTPEGARDFLVPSRVHQGQFFALPQSPQTLKQLLMVGGFDRYFQIARCFRDEDLRADRQPEFSQVDIEMSFVDTDDVMSSNEELLRRLWKKFKNYDVPDIPRISYKEAMDKYGSDKPDLRNPIEIKDCGDLLADVEFKVFSDTLKRGGIVRGFGTVLDKEISRSQIDKWTKLAKENHAKGLVWIKKTDSEYLSPVNKFLSQEVLGSVYERLCPDGKGVAILVADDYGPACSALGALRIAVAAFLDLLDKSVDRFCWIVDFPLLEYDAEAKRYVACHHPFTMLRDEDVSLLEKGDAESMKKLLAKAYDLTCNGYEIAGGSVRIHRSDIQASIFKALGFSEEEAKAQFGFFLDALKYGTPPHGGIAWGVERLIMVIAGTDSIRDVVAFPKTAKAMDLMADAPGPVSNHQLLELGVRLSTKA